MIRNFNLADFPRNSWKNLAEMSALRFTEPGLTPPWRVDALTAGAYNLRLFYGEICSHKELLMNYAIIRSGGKQFRVESGATVRVPSIDKQAGEAIELETLLVGGDETKVGESVASVKVAATVVEHGRGDKIIVFKKKRRKQYKRKQGHRQDYTTLKIESIG